MQTCQIDGCERPSKTRGWCHMHYMRWYTTGEAGGPAPLRVYGRPWQERFWEKVDRRGPDDCWPWLAGRCPDGYGMFAHDKDPVTGRRGSGQGAHRVAYELLVGPVPVGLVLDHLCRVRHCVNPAHLEPVTNLVNIQRGAPATKTHCKRGHSLTDPANLKPTKSGKRQCRKCLHIARHDRYVRLGR